MNDPIERLSAATDSHALRIGGKGAGLLRLIDAGLDVPEAWVVPAGVSLDDDARRECTDEHLPDWWAHVSTDFPGNRWAVRSSAVAEDLEDASFAGVYQTVLGVDSLDSLLLAVKQCWGALEDVRASTYLGEQGMASDAGIALVLQRMIEPDAAGVLLTQNPLHPFADEIVINASYGLGEAVVSGRTDPDYLELDRHSGEIVEERIGAKEIEIVWADGVVERDVPPSRRAGRCLSDAHVSALHELADHVETSIGARRDLEWAIEGDRLFVLQDRPITGLPSREPHDVWTRRFGDEYLADYLTPLGYDLMMPWITTANMDETAILAGRPDVAAMTKVRRHEGYLYLSGQYVLALAQGLPVDARAGTLTDWFGPQWKARIHATPYQPKLLLKQLLSPRKDPGRGPAKANPAALERHCARIEEQIVPLLSQDYAALDNEEWLVQWRVLDEFGRDHFRVIRWGMAHHLPILQAALAGTLRRWVDPDSAALEQTLISGLPGTHTARINREVHALGLLAREDDALTTALRSDATYAGIRRDFADSPFWASFDGFLQRHGHRSASREISIERWHEQPDVILGLVRAQVGADLAGDNPEVFEKRAEERRRAAEREVLQSVGRGPRGAVRRKVLTSLMRRTQLFTVYRENQRYHLDYLLTHLRSLALAQGRRLVDEGVLERVDDVFLLDETMFWPLLEAGHSPDVDAVRAEIAERRAHRERHSVKLPATFLFDDVPAEDDDEVDDSDLPPGTLRGVAASAGRVTAPTRAVARLDDLSSVKPGEILVASNIDPGWTSVFPMIAGLVTETGGVLSHGAILAREYGIPTVTCVGDALRLLPTGTVLDLDGSRGTVVIHEA